MTIRVVSLNEGGLINDLVPDFKPYQDFLGIYPFPVRCVVVRGRPARHESFTYYLDVGRGDIDLAMYGGDLSGYLTFFMPERHMSVHEQQRLPGELARHKDKDKITCVDIITSCPLIISNFVAEAVRIVSYPDDAHYEGR